MRARRLWCVIGACVMTLAWGSAAVGQGQAPPADPDPALRDYLSANGLLARGMNDLAAKEYRQFLEEHSTHKRAPSARYALAVALSREKQFGPALEQLDAVARLDSFEFGAEAAILRGQCLMALSKHADAAVALQDALKRFGESPLAPDAAAMLAEARYRAGAFKDVEEARALLERRWPESPKRDRAEYFAGLALVSLDRPKEAAARFAALAERWPTSALASRASLLVAQCSERAGDSAAAGKQYRAVAESKDAATAPAALLGMARLRLEAGKPDEARPLLDRVLSEFKDSPEATDARLERGRALLECGDTKRAMADFDAYATAPGADAALAEFWRARCEAKAGKPDDAARRLEAVLGAKPSDDLRPLALLDLAADRGAAGDEKSASAAYERFLKECPAHAQRPDALEALATLRHRAGDTKGSAALCEEFIAEYPDHVLRARIEFIGAEDAFLAGDLKQAKPKYDAFLKSHAADANAPLARFRLACAEYREGNTGGARPLFEESAREAKANAALRPALLYLGDIAYQTRDWAGAEQRLREFLAFGADQPGADDATLKLGLALHRLGRDADAVAEYDRLLKDYPKSELLGFAALERARALVAGGKNVDAKEQLATLSQGKDERLAAMATVQLGMLASAGGDPQEAGRCFEEASAAKDVGTKADALLGLGSVELDRGEYQKAVDAFDRLLREAPESPRAAEASARRGIALARLKPGAEALSELDSALKEKGLGEELRGALTYERATCLRQMGRAAEADQAMQSVASGGQGPALRISAALDLARAQTDAKKHAEAAATLHAVQPDATNAEVPEALRESLAYQTAACEFRQEHYREAADLFEKFLKDYGKSDLAGSASLLAGESLRSLKKPKRAVTHYRDALEQKLSDADRETAVLRLGECLADLQDWPASESAFASHLEKFPKSDLWFQSRFGRGWALENQGKFDDAIAEYRRITATHQGPTAARAQFQVGECLFARGKHEEAARELLKVDILYAYPEWSAGALYEAGRCFEAMGKASEARAQYEAVRDKHAGTRWATLASERLASQPRGGAGGKRSAGLREPGIERPPE